MLRVAPLDRMSGIPFYQQIQQQLTDQFRSGALVPGEPLPSIQELAARFGVSQMTARQAIRALCDLGVIYSRQGKGTFVSGLKLEKNFRQVLSFTEEMGSRGSKPWARVLSFQLQLPSPEVREALQLRAREKVFRLRRVRFVDAFPMAIECSWLPVRICPDLLERYDPATSLYHALAEQYGIQLTVTNEVVEAGSASAEEARLLQIPLRSPVFLFTRTSFQEGGQRVEYVRSTYRGDRYKIVNRLTRMGREFLPFAAQP